MMMMMSTSKMLVEGERRENGIVERTHRGARTQGTSHPGCSTEMDAAEEGGSGGDDGRRPWRSEAEVAVTQKKTTS
jgi:hypothetical protein